MELAQSSKCLMELIPHSVVVIDLQTRSIAERNATFACVFGLPIGAPLNQLNGIFHRTTTVGGVAETMAMEVQAQGKSMTKQMAMRTKDKGVRNFDVQVRYVDERQTSVYLVFSPSAYDAAQKELQNGYYEIISTASFSYPFFLDVKTRRIEFFGPILEQFKMQPIMENFPEPVVSGGVIVEEDLPGYLAMVERMYRGEPPQGTFRTYTPTGDILSYSINYTVQRDRAGNPVQIIGDFINIQDPVKSCEPRAIQSSQGTENKILVHQIKAHFFFNTLNTISALCKQDAAKAEEAIKTFAAYMRSYMYLITEEENIPFDQELSLVKSSLEIEKMRFPDSFEYVLDLQYRDFELPPLSLQPIVENALLHGLRKTGRHGQLKISSKKDGDMVYITIADNGRGFDTTQLENSGSIGLKNLMQRVKLMANGTVAFYSEIDKGTTVVVGLPI